jgi:phage terminase large subunit-like protein
MIQGESGIMATAPAWFRPVYESSKRKLTWPNGAIAYAYSAEEPERLRGPQQGAGWLDEMCAWKYMRDTWDMYQFGLRLGEKPITIITTTPKPTKLLKEIVADEGTVMTKGSTYDNLENLAPTFAKTVVAKYEGTRLGRQELNAEILDDNPDALWTSEMIELHRISFDNCPDLIKLGVAVDPAVTANKDSDETGIICGGVAYIGEVLHGYILEDASLKAKPEAWARAAVREYKAYEADRIVAEVNNGGDLVEANLRSINADVSYQAVRASRGKAVRAEPVSSLYEQGRIHHVGTHGKLEDQMTDWNPLDKDADSPDRMDALVWLITYLFDLDKDKKGASGIRTLGNKVKARD